MVGPAPSRTVQVAAPGLQCTRPLRWSPVAFACKSRRGCDRPAAAVVRASGVAGAGGGASRQKHWAMKGRRRREPCQRILQETGLGARTDAACTRIEGAVKLPRPLPRSPKSGPRCMSRTARATAVEGNQRGGARATKGKEERQAAQCQCASCSSDTAAGEGELRKAAGAGESRERRNSLENGITLERLGSGKCTHPQPQTSSGNASEICAPGSLGSQTL